MRSIQAVDLHKLTDIPNRTCPSGDGFSPSVLPLAVKYKHLSPGGFASKEAEDSEAGSLRQLRASQVSAAG
jgi:hypothetical protein